MRRYETTYILRPNLGEEQFSEVIERTNDIVTNDGGAIINLERLGNRKLAYEIKKEILGQYIYFDFAAPGKTIHEMERIFRIDDRVLRFLTVKLADSIDEATVTSEIERVEAVEAERKSAEEEAAAESSAGEATSEETDDSADTKEPETVEIVEENTGDKGDEETPEESDVSEDDQTPDDTKTAADEK